jgi:diketogulonate reductase-like aldo/keto reductase
VSAVVRRTGRTLPQIVFRFALQARMVPLTGTGSEAHMREDLACLDFELDPDDAQAIERCAG